MKLATINRAAATLREGGIEITAYKIRGMVARDEIRSLNVDGTDMLVDVDALRELLEDGGTVGTEELAEETGLSMRAIRKLAADGRIPRVGNGRTLRFRVADVERAIDGLMQEGRV